MAHTLCILSPTCCVAICAGALRIRGADLGPVNEMVHAKWQKMLGGFSHSLQDHIISKMLYLLSCHILLSRFLQLFPKPCAD